MEKHISVEEAKAALDSLIRKSRVHLYKPIQIAEYCTIRECTEI